MSLVINFHDQVNDNSIELLIKHIESVRYYNIPITIDIDSPGGSVVAGFRFLQYMKSNNIEFDTYCDGMAASMGLAMYICGKFRVATSTAEFMNHGIRYGIEGTLHDHKEKVRRAQEKQDLLEKIIYNKTLLTPEIVEKARNANAWFSGQECLDYKIVDKIVSLI